jgi:hypothetical protein
VVEAAVVLVQLVEMLQTDLLQATAAQDLPG